VKLDHKAVPAPAKREGMRYLESKRRWLTVAMPFDAFGDVRVGSPRSTGRP
jgi:hypothetical protein